MTDIYYTSIGDAESQSVISNSYSGSEPDYIIYFDEDISRWDIGDCYTDSSGGKFVLTRKPTGASGHFRRLRGTTANPDIGGTMGRAYATINDWITTEGASTVDLTSEQRISVGILADPQTTWITNGIYIECTSSADYYVKLTVRRGLEWWRWPLPRLLDGTAKVPMLGNNLGIKTNVFLAEDVLLRRNPPPETNTHWLIGASGLSVTLRRCAVLHGIRFLTLATGAVSCTVNVEDSLAVDCHYEFCVGRDGCSIDFTNFVGIQPRVGPGGGLGFYNADYGGPVFDFNNILLAQGTTGNVQLLPGSGHIQSAKHVAVSDDSASAVASPAYDNISHLEFVRIPANGQDNIPTNEYDARLRPSSRLRGLGIGILNLDARRQPWKGCSPIHIFSGRSRRHGKRISQHVA